MSKWCKHLCMALVVCCSVGVLGSARAGAQEDVRLYGPLGTNMAIEEAAENVTDPATWGVHTGFVLRRISGTLPGRRSTPRASGAGAVLVRGGDLLVLEYFAPGFMSESHGPGAVTEYLALEPIGVHCIAELYDCPPALLDNGCRLLRSRGRNDVLDYRRYEGPISATIRKVRLYRHGYKHFRRPLRRSNR